MPRDLGDNDLGDPLTAAADANGEIRRPREDLEWISEQPDLSGVSSREAPDPRESSAF